MKINDCISHVIKTIKELVQKTKKSYKSYNNYRNWLNGKTENLWEKKTPPDRNNE